MVAAIHQMFSVKETPWHGEGHVLPEHPSLIEVPHYVPTFDEDREKVRLYDETGKPLDYYQVRNSVTKDTYGFVGPRYEIMQPRDTLGLLEPLLDTGMLQIETAGSLFGGKRIWILCTITNNTEMRIVGEDTVKKYILFSDSYDGTMALSEAITAIRVVCNNTLSAAHNSKDTKLIRIRHTKSIKANAENVRDTINLVNQTFEATAEQYRQLANSQICVSDLEKYVKVVFGLDKIKEEDLSSRAKNKIEKVTNLFESEYTNNLPGIRGTVWAAYNAVTHYLSHDASKNMDQRYNSLWFGQNANINELALKEGIKLAA